VDCFVAEPVIGRAFARPVGSSQYDQDVSCRRFEDKAINFPPPVAKP